MTPEHENIKVTAYALGELPPEEIEAFERELAASEELRAELEGVENTVAQVRAELERDGAALSERRRALIERAAAVSSSADAGKQVAPVAPLPRRRMRRVALWGGAGLGLSAAAAFALFVGSSRMESPDDKAVYMQAAASAAPAPPSEEGLMRAAKSGGADYKSKAKSGRFPAAPPGDGLAAEQGGDLDRERYDHITDNPFIRVAEDPRSTFSIDVDTASYALMRRHLVEGNLPPKGAVRIEEMLNYFHYEYPEPTGAHPFSVTTDVTSAPWAPEHRLVRIGLKAKHVQPAEVPGTNLVFLLDVSGSMNDPNKLPLLKRSFAMLVEQLDENDSVAIVVYAGASGLALPATRGNRKQDILGALERLEAGGSTNGGEGIRLAYDIARKQFIRGGINRVLLATDGDFNVGTSSESELVDLIEKERQSGVYLSVLGLGGGNYNDSTLEKLADKGNGNYSYIDSLPEARKVLVEQATGTLMTVAKDVKIQLEFNPAEVAGFRLIGYENRVLAHQDFNDDKKDAGEIGADHTVTALYEVVPAGGKVPSETGDPLKYQTPPAPAAAAASGELLTVKLRYKQPDSDTSQLLETAVRDSDRNIDSANPELRFAAAVAEFGMLLRESPYRGSSSFAQIRSLASDAATSESRREFLTLVQKAETLRQ
ncbi:MAG: von Willebrand factor type A domain-containing protein [Polyangiaceae bacterium]